MAKSANADLKDELSQDAMEQSVQECFLECLNKCREIVGLKYKSEAEIDSEVSLAMHGILHEFDKFRTNRK